MITLSNGDRWILGSSEWKDVGISYEDACKCKIPETSKREFVEKLCKYYSRGYNEKELNVEPRKWTNEFEGYWDGNFNVFSEVFGDLAIRTVSNPWSRVYEMPWGDVVVVYTDVDSGGYDAAWYIEVYKNLEDYNAAVCVK